ncbi:B-cell linker protein [Pyxicephalus adspersus]|uniref:B-cell linker protein n=1 Tax=Pyxicephalus adspersus TaxID=30357 RepID=UPI003B5A1092
MAFKLPLREDFESWATYQVVDFLKQCSLHECTGVVEKMGMTGHTFLNMTEYDLNKFKILYQPQLQKMVHEIKNNEGGLMQKFKRFQNDQVALFCKTGKDAWDRITHKPPPSVPRRDYVAGPQDDETDEWSDEFASDYENPDDHSDRDETYVDPNEEEESYEPPPNEPEPRFTPSYKFVDRNGGYAEKDRNQQLPNPLNDQITRPIPPLPKTKETFAKPLPTLHQINNRSPLSNKPAPKPMPKPAVAARQPPSQSPRRKKKPERRPQQQHQDDEDYVLPGDEEEDDNYIQPTPSPETHKPPIVNRAIKPGQSAILMSPNQNHEPDLYEVPENTVEVKPSPPARYIFSYTLDDLHLTHLSKHAHNKNNGFFSQTADRKAEPPMKSAPSPLPRNVKPRAVLPKPKTPGSLPRDVNSNVEKPPVVERQRMQSAGSELPPTPPSRQKPPETTTRYVVNQSRQGSTVEQDAKVLNKEWYSASCDRKAAEEALLASSKDGSFLVRRSTGQDLKQPFTLVVFYKRRVYNIPVRYIESTQQYALGREKSGEEKFSSVAEMIENHQRTNLVLIDSQTNTKDLTRLLHAVKVP